MDSDSAMVTWLSHEAPVDGEEGKRSPMSVVGRLGPAWVGVAYGSPWKGVCLVVKVVTGDGGVLVIMMGVVFLWGVSGMGNARS